MVELLKFERKGFDFPFYKDDLSKDRWFALILGFLIPTILIFSNLKIPHPVFEILIFLIPTLAFVYASKGDFSLILKKPRERDIVLILVLVFLEVIYTNTLDSFFEPIFEEYAFTLFENLLLVFQLFGEELNKFFVFIILFTVLMKYSDNRKVSMAIATTLMLIYFGLMHETAYPGRTLENILTVGFGSIFTMFAYLKTKNIFVSYLCHILFDIIQANYWLFQ